MKIRASVHAANQNGGKTVSTDRLDALIVADGTCPQIRRLLAGAQAQIHWLTGEREALSSISSLLDKHPCRQLNLIGHGRGGAIRFGPEWINRKDLLKQADRLAKWDLERIALWSCELGQDSRFATTLEYLTGVAWPLEAAQAAAA